MNLERNGGGRDLTLSKKVKQFEKLWTRHERTLKFAAAGRICPKCGIVAGSAAELRNHASNKHHFKPTADAEVAA